jgi:hypothetical protein
MTSHESFEREIYAHFLLSYGVAAVNDRNVVELIDGHDTVRLDTARRCYLDDLCIFRHNFGAGDIASKRTWINVLHNSPTLSAENRAALVRKFATEAMSGKTAPELEQDGIEKDATIAKNAKRIAELEEDLADAGRLNRGKR